MADRKVRTSRTLGSDRMPVCIVRRCIRIQLDPVLPAALQGIAYMTCDRERGISPQRTTGMRHRAAPPSPRQCQNDQWHNACTRPARRPSRCSALPRTADIRPLVPLGRHYRPGARIVHSRTSFASLDAGSGPRDMLHTPQHGSAYWCTAQLGTVGRWCLGRKIQACKSIRAPMDCARRQPPPHTCDTQPGGAYQAPMHVAARMSCRLLGDEKWRFEKFRRDTARTPRGELSCARRWASNGISCGKLHHSRRTDVC